VLRQVRIHGIRVMDNPISSFLGRLLKPRVAPAATDEGAPSQDSTAGDKTGSIVARDAAQAQPSDAQVREWKGSWVRGADSRWSGASLLTNPYKAGSSGAAAWRAGWHWADRQPDRRHSTPVRFAHAHRRRADGSSHLVRRAQAGAVGLSVLTIAGWLWQIRRQRTRRQ